MTINIENFKRVRESVAANPEFDMTTFAHPCGTAACIMGSAFALLGIEPSAFIGARDAVWSVDMLGIRIETSDFLGIDPDDDFAYISGGWWSANTMSGITKAEALEYLDKVIETGDVKSVTYSF